MAGKAHWALAKQKLTRVGMFGRPEGTKVLTDSYWREFFGPDHPATVGNGNVRYLAANQLSKHKVTFDEKNIVVPKTSVFTIGISATTKRNIIFAVDSEWGFYVGITDTESQRRFHHSSFLAGMPVLGTGTIILKQGFEIEEVKLMRWSVNIRVDMHVAVCVNRTSPFVVINGVSP
jgi:hypothetical protein